MQYCNSSVQLAWLQLWSLGPHKLQEVDICSLMNYTPIIFSVDWSTRKVSNARLITYFGNFVFCFLSLRLRDFPYNVFHLQGKMGKTKWKINKLLCNILVTSSPKTTKNEVTKMWWNAQIFWFSKSFFCVNFFFYWRV